MKQNTDADARTDAQKAEMTDHFEAYEYEYRKDADTDAEVVYEDAEAIIVADHSGHELNEWADDLGVDRSELSESFHALARQKCDYDWSVSDPIVFDKRE